MISAEQIEFFEENGYLKFGKVLDPEAIEALRVGLDRVAQLELEEGDDTSPEFKYGHDRKGERFGIERQQPRAIHQFVNMWKRDKAYEDTIHHPVIADTVCALLRTPEVRLWHDQIISKPPKDNGHFAFHHDFFFWPLSPPEIVTCWLAVDDATVASGCMHVIPKSHRDKRFSIESRRAVNEAAEQARAEGRTPERNQWDEMRELDISHGQPVELKAGECMFHHCLNFHATPPNTTNFQRRGFVMIFMAQGVRYNKAQSPNHVLVPTIEVEDGQPLVGSGFPVA